LANDERVNENRQQAGDEEIVSDETLTDGSEAQEVSEAVADLSLEEQLASAEAKAAEYLDGWQRARAEFANARKRLERERGEARRNATIDLAERLLPILDDFERALEAVPANIADDNWFEGVALVYRKLRAILENVNIARIEALGQPFDPNVHEAVLEEESDEYESGIVVKELQTGYRLDDRVIRPALVIVAA